CGERIENKPQAQRLIPESEPGEILDRTEAVRPARESFRSLQRRKECRNGHCKHRDLSGDCQYGRTFAPGARQTQTQERSRKGHRREEPEITYDPWIHPLSWLN